MPTVSRRVLLTGGAGFIGRHTARALVAAGAEVRALDNLNPQVHRDAERSVAQFPGEVRSGDVRDDDAVAAAVRGCDAVVHLAAETGVGQSMYEVERYRTVNVDGTAAVLRHAAGAPVVVLSSRAVYGEGAFECPGHGRRTGAGCCSQAVPSASREDDDLAPVSVYGDTKVGTEQMVADAAGATTLVLRPQNVVGPGQALHNPYTGVLAAFASRLRQGEPPLVYGTGRQTRDFLAVEDVAAVIVWALADPAGWATYPVLNVGSGQRTTLLELARTAAACAGNDRPLEFVDVHRAGDIEHACADLTRAQAAGAPPATRTLAETVGAFLAAAGDEAPVDPAIWNEALSELGARAGAAGPRP